MKATARVESLAVAFICPPLPIACIVGVDNERAAQAPPPLQHGSARQDGFEARGVLRLCFLHGITHEEFGYFGDVAGVDGEMHAAG